MKKIADFRVKFYLSIGYRSNTTIALKNTTNMQNGLNKTLVTSFSTQTAPITKPNGGAARPNQTKSRVFAPIIDPLDARLTL